MLHALLLLVHLIGLALGVGGATAKLVLLLKTRSDQAFVPLFMRVAGPLTRLILAGIVLLTLSGIAWVLLGYPLTARLVIKLVLVAAIWIIGPVIDKVVEPRFRLLAAAPEGLAAPAFRRVRGQFVLLETVATLLFYAVIVYWVLA